MGFTARRPGPRADLRRSPRHHGRRRASRRRCSSTGRCATPTAACACSARRRSAAAAIAASAPTPAAIPLRSPALPHTLRDGSPVKRDPATGFPFSMKDLALPDHVPALRSAGVSCFKIEGRKKSPLYVATTTDYYRKLIDGTLTEADRPQHEADLQTVFSRPWTRLFVESHKDKEVADRDTRRPSRRPDRHRSRRSIATDNRAGCASARARRAGTARRPAGRSAGAGQAVRFRRPPYVGARTRRRKLVVEAPAGSLVEVELPQDHREEPELPVGSLVYCSSSQAVKRDVSARSAEARSVPHAPAGAGRSSHRCKRSSPLSAGFSSRSFRGRDRGAVPADRTVHPSPRAWHHERSSANRVRQAR